MIKEIDSGQPGNSEQVTSAEKRKDLAELIKKAIYVYGKNLREDIRESEDKLDRESQEKYQDHLKQLSQLFGMINLWTEGQLEVRERRKKETYPQNSDVAHTTRSVRYGPINQGFKAGADQELQLSMHINVENIDEAETETIHALSVKGSSPQRVLDKLSQQRAVMRIIFNTVAVQRDLETGRFSINPQAGVVFYLDQYGHRSAVGGVVYVGDSAHAYETTRNTTDKSIQPTRFMQLFDMVMGA